MKLNMDKRTLITILIVAAIVAGIWIIIAVLGGNAGMTNTTIPQ